MSGAMRKKAGEAGFTMLGTLVAAVLLVLVLGIASLSVISGQKVIGQGNSMTDVELNVSRVFSSLLADLRATGTNIANSGLTCVGSNCTDPYYAAPGGVTNHFIKFKKVIRYDEGTNTTIWDVNPVEYWFEYAKTANGYSGAAETGIATDNNSNGLAGEGVLKRRYNGKTVIMAKNILGASFSISQPDTSKPEVRVTIEIATRLSDKSVFKRKITERVLLRN